MKLKILLLIFNLYKYKRLTSGCCLARLHPYTKSALIDNMVCFSSPCNLNDPFECSYYANGKHENMQINDFKIFSTSRTPHDIPMWVYYGDSHTGICIEYSFLDIMNVTLDRFPYSFGNNVIYITRKLTNLDYKAIESCFGFKFAKIYFSLLLAFTKSVKWNHEKEFRIIVLDKDFDAIDFTNNVAPNKSNILVKIRNKGFYKSLLCIY